LPAVQEALTQLEAPYGRYVVIGNHDLIDDAEELVNFLGRHEAHFLCDQLEQIDIGGEKMQIAGLFWSGQELPTARDPGMVGRAQHTLAASVPGRFTLALAHHPHAFEGLAGCGANVVLAGHTHGGQVMLTPPGAPLRLGAGNLLFRYIYGEYALGDARLYVNSGVGNWLPLRINAPAELVKIRLV
jgi:predicted MPP superfamily phosphohydrolase